MDAMAIVLTFGDLLGLSWTILEFVVTRIWFFVMLIITIIMAKTLLDLSQRVLNMAKPGIRKLKPKSRRR